MKKEEKTKGNHSRLENEEKNINTYKVNKDDIKKQRKSKFKAIIIIVLIIIILIAINLGIYIASWQNMVLDMVSNTPSVVLDIDGKTIATIGNNKNISNVSIEEIPDNLKNAYISIEDQRFYKHNGVDLPRTAAAIFSYVRNVGSSSFGGSSITQQLVKNITGDSSSKVSRKVKEWIKAWSLEAVLTKDEILEAYLNIIYTGPNIYGVDLAAKYYFNKDLENLTLEECAFIAGINNSPNSYNPFGENDNSEKIKTRTTAVLSKMLELGYISQEEYDASASVVNKGLTFKQGKIDEASNDVYSYHTDALITEILEDIEKKKNISEDFAMNYLNMAGLKIYSTQDSSIQSTIEEELNKSKYKLKSQKDSSTTSQAAMVIIDQDTGYVVGCVGGIGKKTESRTFNRATQATRQTGSAGKPVSVLVPAIDKKIITAATIFADEETTFDDGTEEGYSPKDYNDYKGDITVREAVESSQNIPFVKIMELLTPKTSIEYMKKMGITTLTDKDENLNLALGGLDKGISPLELASAYATIANGGTYIEPTFYTKIENSAGKTIVKTSQTKRKVISKEVAYIVTNLLTEPVNGSSGTATYCKINGIDVAAKTGTTNDEYDRWLCGFTPYYTAVTWFGYDQNETIRFNGRNPSGQIWSSVMKTIHANLSNAKFEMPDSDNIVTYEICPITGLLASDKCNGYVEYFLAGTEPTTYCTSHSSKANYNTLENNKNEEETTDKVEEIQEEKENIVNEEGNNIISQESTNTQNNNTQENTITNKIENTATNTNTIVENEDEIVEDDTQNNEEENYFEQ